MAELRQTTQQLPVVVRLFRESESGVEDDQFFGYAGGSECFEPCGEFGRDVVDHVVVVRAAAITSLGARQCIAT